MKVLVFPACGGWQWSVVAANGSELARSLRPTRRARAVDQAERLAAGMWPVEVVEQLAPADR